MTKLTREQARAYHPAVWTPDDFHQTVRDAQAVVEAGKRRFRVVGEDERGAPTLLLSRSRERTAKRMDALAVALLMALMAALGCIALLLATPHAKADSPPSDELLYYTATYGGAACQVLDQYNSVGGLIGVMQGVMEDGWTAFESGQIVGLAVYEICPRHVGLIERFQAIYGEQGALA